MYIIIIYYIIYYIVLNANNLIQKNIYLDVPTTCNLPTNS